MTISPTRSRGCRKKKENFRSSNFHSFQVYLCDFYIALKLEKNIKEEEIKKAAM